MTSIVFGTAMFMASLAALTSVGMVHYINVSCCLAILFLIFGLRLSHWCSTFEPLIFIYFIGFFINFFTITVSMTFFGVKDKGSILGLSCIAYVVFGFYLFYAMYFILGPKLDNNKSNGKNVLICITFIYFGWAYFLFRLF